MQFGFLEHISGIRGWNAAERGNDSVNAAFAAVRKSDSRPIEVKQVNGVTVP
jgi:hypothetical protein